MDSSGVKKCQTNALHNLTRIVWLRSSTDRSCAIPRTHNTIGDSSFAVAGPRVWNSLPAHLRDEDITYGGFRRELNTFCLNVASRVQ